MHIYVDETKRRDYLLVASVHVPADIGSLRKVVAELLLPGQRSLHMKDQKEGRKRTIAKTFVEAGVQATIYRAGQDHRNEKARRRACIEALVDDHASDPSARIILDEDESMVSLDRQIIIERSRLAGCGQTLSYEHRDPPSEPLLSIPDALAWCYAKGGTWRELVKPAVMSVRDV